VAHYEVNVPRELLPGLLVDKEPLAKLIETILNQILEAQMTEHLKAKPHERTEDRQGYRNGSRLRTLTTRVGPLTLVVPQTRDGSFSTEIFRRYQRSEQAFVLALMEMYLQGVSTRKVKEITEALCGSSFSRSTLSRLTTELDAKVFAFTHRRLDHTFPFLILDAMFIKVREEDRVAMRAALIAVGVNDKGHREVLGLALGDSESFTSWDDLLKELKGRGLKEVSYVVSDDHTGLARAIQKNLQGAVWQRCQVHLMRNVLGHSPSKLRSEVAHEVKLILLAPDMDEARRRLEAFRERFARLAPKAVACLEEGFEDAMAVMALPEKYRTRFRSTNMLERLNEEIRRRERVIRIFPNQESAIRLIGAMLAQIHEEWLERKYLDMEELNERKPPQDKGPVILRV
jgi:transposase-like protein